MKKKRTYHLAALAAGGAAAAALYGTADYLLRVAMARRQPASLRVLTGMLEGQKKGENPYAGLEDGQEQLRNVPHETVSITAHDGVRLVGHWFACENAERVILAVHGWRSRWYRDFGAVAGFWQENRCSVLYIEQRGQGESGGECIGLGLLEYADLPDWLRWINTRCGDTLPVYLAGISMGATTVLLCADRELPANVRGIMADCGFTSADAIWKHVAKNNLHLLCGPLLCMANRLCRKKYGLSPSGHSTVDALKHAKVPVLLFHGEDDRFVPVEMSWENYAACTAPKQIFTVPGAGHGLSYLVRKDEYEAVEKQFWAAYD